MSISATINNTKGQPDWAVASSSASVTNVITTTNGAVNKPEVLFSVDFTNLSPIDITVTDLAYGTVNDAELKALFDPVITNDTGVNWSGFNITLIDLDSADSSAGGGLHPMWAHFHDDSNKALLPGWLDPFTGVFPYDPNDGFDRLTPNEHQAFPFGDPLYGSVSSYNGATELEFSGGVFAPATSEDWYYVGIHEWDASMSMSNHFVIQLQPVSTDRPADATTSGFVAAGGYSPGTIEIAGDHDWFSIQLTAGVQYRFDVEGDTIGASSPALQNPSMRLFNPSSQLIASNDDSAPGNPDPEIVFTPTASGKYYIDVGGSQDVYTGSYRVIASAFDISSDLLFQNLGTGQAVIWTMAGSARTGGGPLTANPGPDWKAVGRGDFDHDGRPDILWQNTATGQAAVWEMFGTTRTGGGPVIPNPGPAWTAVTAADFDNDGFADILWQNATTGQMSIWEMNENTRIGGGALSANPGPTWKAVGTGDFNEDGSADVLFQNKSTGQVAIWEMDGTTRIGGGTLSISPGLAWAAIGTGDFNGDGLSDILFQNGSTGQIAIWEMNETTHVGGGVVATIPGTAWHAIGANDSAEVLFQNASTGQTSIWEMDGATRIGGGAVNVNAGPSWRAVGLG
jgi:hypothetical protein